MTDRSARDASPAQASSNEWSTIAPTLFVLFVLAALVLLPFAYGAYVHPTRERMREAAQPARGQITRIHVELAREGALISDYIESRDEAVARRYREVVDSGKAATRELGPLTVRLGDSVRAHFAQMLSLQEAWHAAADSALAALAAGAPPSAERLRRDVYEELLLAAAHLDDAIDDETREAEADIVRSEQWLRWVSASLALLGLGAAGAVAWLARRLRLHAADAEQRRAELERVVEGRARLMRGVSHDLKNPMHAIEGHAQLIEDGLLGPLTPAQQDSVARIRRALRPMLGFLNDLLEPSRVEAGQLAVSARSVDMAALLHESVEEHRASARAAGHQLDLTIAQDVPVIVTDPARVGQVLGNLLSNAVKYTPHGGRIAVRAEQRAREGVPQVRRWLAIDVVDSGPGIPDDELDSIFDEFARLAQHADKPGSGLGLAIARRIATLLGGDITVCTERPQGARFTLWLPASTQPTPRHTAALES